MNTVLKSAILTFISFQVFAMPKEVNLATQDWRPYQVTFKDKLIGGISLKAIDCVFSKLNIKYNVKVLPWKRAQLGVKNNDYDGFFAAAKAVSRETFAVASAPFIRQRWSFYSHKKLPNKNKIKRQLNVAARDGSATLMWLKENDYKWAPGATRAESFTKQFINKRFETIMENDDVLKFYLRKNKVKISKFQKIKNISKPLGVYFNKNFVIKHPGFLSKFNRYALKCSNI